MPFRTQFMTGGYLNGPFRSVALLLFVAAFSAPVFAQYPNGYTYRGTLTIPASKVSKTDQTNFPVLIAGTYPDLRLSTQPGGRVTNVNGYDIIFSSDPNGATVLPFERELYSGTTGQVAFWVLVPVLSHTVDTVLYVFYGNGSVAADPSNKTGVWDSNYIGVWHMGDSAASPSVLDSTSNANNGTAAANTSSKSAPGIAGATLNFNGTTDRVTTPVSVGKTFTWEAWVNSASITNSSYQSLITLDGAGYMLMDVQAGAGSFWAPDSLAATNLGVTGLVNNTWYHLVFVRSGDSASSGYVTYLNGVLRGQAASGTWNKTENLTFGSRLDVAGQSLSGKLDEIRVSKTVRSPDWITTEFRNISDPGTFYSAAWGQTNGVTPSSLSVSLSSLSFSATEGGANPAAQSVDVSNSGAALNWTATSTAPWLSISTSAIGGGSTVLSGTGAAKIWIQVSSGALTAAGSPYTGVINFTAAGATPPLPAINVSLSVSAPPPPGSQWGNGYSFRGTLTVPYAQVSNSDQSKFPVLVSGTYRDLAGLAVGGKVTSPNGYDIIFTSDPQGSNPLPYEREAYSPNGQVVFWVQVANLSHTADNTFYVFYGNSAVTTDQSNKAGVWDSSYVGVWHMADNAASATVSDSTANANNGTAAVNTAARSTTGSINTALTFNGTTDRVTTPVSSGKIFTWEAWVNSATMTGANFQSLITLGGAGYMLMDTQSGGGSFWAPDALGGGNLGISGLTNNVWYHVVFVRSGDSAASGYRAYVNGSLKGQTPSGIWNTSANFTFGSRLDVSGQSLSGKLDEVRISKIARSSDWIATEFRNLSNPGSFYSATWGLTADGIPPVLSVAPSSLSYTATAGQADPAAQSLQISNSGGGMLNWTATASPSSLLSLYVSDPASSSATVTGTAPQTLLVQAGISGLQTGIYSGNVTISSTGVTPALQSVVSVSVKIAPTPPVLTATPGEQQNSLSWSAIPGATSYSIFRGTAAGAESATPLAAGITATTYTDTALLTGTQYFYKVIAISPGGQSGFSNEANAIPTAPSLTPLISASRFLRQASWGPTQATVNRVNQIGINAYIDEQFATPPSDYPDSLKVPGTLHPLQKRFFQNGVTGNDQLRQRVAFAFSQIMVTSAVKPVVDYSNLMTSYQKLLLNSALGNFYDLIRAVTLHPDMGRFLDMVNSIKAAPGQSANENYARELLQLFTMGVVKLNPDGTPMLDSAGNPIPNYSQTDIKELARIFTGWTYGDNNPAPPVSRNYEPSEWPMEPVESLHDTGSKTFLGVTFPANQTATQDLDLALQTIFHQPSAGPFISKLLIQHLVTSNPSPAYVGRVAAAFADNGAGVRGDLKAVVKAILLDSEASLGQSGSGHLREPALFEMATLRALNANLTDAQFLVDQAQGMGQWVFFAPSVFNYYSPSYRTDSGILGPEFQLFTTASTLVRDNFIATLLTVGFYGATIDLTPYSSIASNPPALLDLINQNLMGGLMSAEMRGSILNAIGQAPNDTEKAQLAIYLTLTSSQFQVEN